MGLSNGGKNRVVGVDITDGHNYPFEFIRSDVFALDERFLEEFDLIWASPPCQQFAICSRRWLNAGYTMACNLIPQTRGLLTGAGRPFIIENVPNAPLRKDLTLCGEMFGLRVVRHRIFEFGWGIRCAQPGHKKHRPRLNKNHSYYCQTTGHGGESYSYKIKDWQDAMGIDWVRDREHLVEMMPPKYVEYITKNIVIDTRT